MRCRFIFLIFTLFIGFTVSAQHLQLVSDVGEFACYSGYSSYNGDVATDVMFMRSNYGAYYKKYLNNFIGLRFNYEKINLYASDFKSSNSFELTRNFEFARNFHEFSIISEHYFNRFISGRKFYKFSPYLSFGIGYLFNTNIDFSSNLPNGARNRILTFPINLGLKYSIYENWNVFVEYKNRKTTSDYIDHLSDKDEFNKIQGSKAGKDVLLSFSIGISYNFRKVFGFEQQTPSDRKRKFADKRMIEEKFIKPSKFRIFKRK